VLGKKLRIVLGLYWRVDALARIGRDCSRAEITGI